MNEKNGQKPHNFEYFCQDICHQRETDENLLKKDKSVRKDKIIIDFEQCKSIDVETFNHDLKILFDKWNTKYDNLYLKSADCFFLK